MQYAENEDQLNEAVVNDDTVLLLTQAGFTNELVKLDNRHRACQCITIHVVFKTRREELEQLREGMESLSLIIFLQVSTGVFILYFPY